MKLTGNISPDEALAIYLQDHRAGASAGLSLAERAADEHRDTPYGEMLRWLVAEITDDVATLERAMEQVGAHASLSKNAVARIGEVAGRFKLNGQLTGSSPLTPVIEFEMLLSGVKSQRHVWMLLKDATDVEVDIDLDQMIARVDEKTDRLHEAWMHAARAAFPNGARASTS